MKDTIKELKDLESAYQQLRYEINNTKNTVAGRMKRHVEYIRKKKQEIDKESEYIEELLGKFYALLEASKEYIIHNEISPTYFKFDDRERGGTNNTSNK